MEKNLSLFPLKLTKTWNERVKNYTRTFILVKNTYTTINWLLIIINYTLIIIIYI